MPDPHGPYDPGSAFGDNPEAQPGINPADIKAPLPEPKTDSARVKVGAGV